MSKTTADEDFNSLGFDKSKDTEDVDNIKFYSEEKTITFRRNKTIKIGNTVITMAELKAIIKMTKEQRWR